MNANMMSFPQLILALSLLTVLLQKTSAIFTDDILVPKSFSPGGLLEESLPTNKRYAMLSYNFGSSRRYSPTYLQSRRNAYVPKRYRYNYFRRPWENLPDFHCYRKRCDSSSDCCQRHNICDPYVKVCHDCWHGYKCQTSNDCCSRYPYCHPHKKECYNWLIARHQSVQGYTPSTITPNYDQSIFCPARIFIIKVSLKITAVLRCHKRTNGFLVPTSVIETYQVLHPINIIFSWLPLDRLL